MRTLYQRSEHKLYVFRCAVFRHSWQILSRLEPGHVGADPPFMVGKGLWRKVF